jgi:DNA end-binding protein Ku
MRAIWSGSLSFGLINIPVRLYSASEERALKFRLLDKYRHSPISYAKVSRETGKEVKYEDIVRGYEYQKGDYVILTDEDFKKANPKKTKLLEVVSFVDETEIASEYVNKPYYIEPDKKAEKAYVLLREAMKRAKKVAVAKIVFKDKEHIAMIKPENKALMLITLRYDDEIRKPKDINLPEEENFSKKELELALTLIRELQEHFRASEYHDTYTEDLKKVIEKKARGEPIRIRGTEQEPRATDMKNLMEILRKSLEEEHNKKVTV